MIRILFLPNFTKCILNSVATLKLNTEGMQIQQIKMWYSNFDSTYHPRQYHVVFEHLFSFYVVCSFSALDYLRNFSI